MHPAWVGELAARSCPRAGSVRNSLNPFRLMVSAMSSLNPVERASARAFPHQKPKHPTACYAVHGAADPGLMPRLTGMFAKRGVVPARWHAAVSADGRELTVDIQVPGLAPAAAAQIAAAMRQIWGVHAVLMSEKVGA